MNTTDILHNTIAFVKTSLTEAEGGHDWWHSYRVWQMAKTISQHEQVDHFIVEIGALLHDIADAKFHDGNATIGGKKAEAFLLTQNVDKASITHIKNIINNISFRGGTTPCGFSSPEMDVIQDADRLDAIGAIGIARTFNYGGYKHRELYNPNIAPKLNMSKAEYQNSSAPTLNHFYEKLLLLKDRMNTSTGRKMAEHRHQVMRDFLKEFYLEWDGER